MKCYDTNSAGILAPMANNLFMTSSPDTSDTDTGVELTENNDGCVQAVREHPIAEDTDHSSSYWTKNCCSGL